MRKFNFKLTTIILLAAMFLNYGCEALSEKKPLSKDELITKLEDQKKDIDRQIKHISIEMKDMSEESKQAFEKSLETLKDRKKDINKTIKKIDKATTEELSDLQKEAQEIFKDLSGVKDQFNDWLDEQKK